MSVGKRITILSQDVINSLYSIPKLNNEARKVLFDPSESDLEIINDLTDISVKINYFLQMGYLRARLFFFNFNFQQVRDDTWFIINNYFPETPFPKKQISKHHHYSNQKKIIHQYKFRQATSEDKVKLRRHAKNVARRHVHPRFIFDELLNYCMHSRIIKPAYSTMQLLVSDTLKNERNRMLNKLAASLNKKARLALDNLLKHDDSLTRLTLLKKDPIDFSTREMRREVAKQKELLNVYKATKSILKKLKSSTKNIEYYADMAAFYSVVKLKRFKKNIARLYLLCYAHQRLLKVNDHLAAFFSYRINKYYQDAEQHSIDQIRLDEEAAAQRLILAGKLIKLYSNESVPDEDLRSHAFQIVPQENINQFAKDLIAFEKRKNKYVWRYLEKQSNSIKINLRPVFKTIPFQYDNNEPIKAAISFLNDQVIDSRYKKYHPIEEVPMEFIPKKLRNIIIEKIPERNDRRRKKIFVNINRYEYMIYNQLLKMLNSGQVYIRESFNYRRLEDELIPHDLWRKNKNKILRNLNIPVLRQPIKKLLKGLNKLLSERYKEINHRIKNGDNEHIKVKKDKNNNVVWRLPYKKQDDTVNNPFYENIPSANISDIIRYVTETTRFHNKFLHIQPYYSKTSVEINNLIACLTANGTGISIGRMATISDMNLNELISTSKNFFRIQTLQDANDTVVNKIANLPIFQFYTLSEYGIHASIDGQKIETKNHTIKARYSKKYFGLGKGVVSLNLVANHVPVSGRIVGANEYEGHFLFDIVYNNSSDISIYAVSGDMHSINRVNFALMYLFGYRFMPRFTRLPHKAQENLVSFKTIDAFDQYIIKPKNIVKKSLIIKEWDNILRIMASLAMKETTQATIVKKLSSYKRSNPTLKALIEFDKVIMSLYMLDYIDDSDMRSNVHRSLNRGESLHQLMSAIRKVSDKKLPGKTEAELDIYNECTRLVANCIIYYNADLLSQLYDEYLGSVDWCNLIKRLSPVAWQHINLIGKYEFCQNQNALNLQYVIENVMTNLKINLAN